LVTNAVKDIADNCFQYINTAEVCSPRRLCPAAGWQGNARAMTIKLEAKIS
jgi:hypothetical protein